MSQSHHELPPASGREENTRERLTEIAQTVNELLPEKWGFMLLIFPFDREPGSVNYVSNCNREDGLKAMEEFLAKAKKG